MNLDPLAQYWYGDKKSIELAVAGLVAGGHLLIEGPPGVGKTRLTDLLAQAFDLKTHRIQGTPDLMPSDIIGTQILGKDKLRNFHPGPVFCQLLQIDEINRITPRTLSALIQAMQEKSISLDGQVHPLPTPFHVVATRSTREIEGVYPLPEAALDRFVLSLRLSLPDFDKESKLLRNHEQDKKVLKKPLGDLESCQKEVFSVSVSDQLISRATALVRLSRMDRDLVFGSGIRGSQSLIHVAKALAWIRERSQVTLVELQDAALSVLTHRLRPIQVTSTTKSFVDRYWHQSDPVKSLFERFGEVLQ